MIFSALRAGWISRCELIKKFAIEKKCHILSCDWVEPLKYDLEFKNMAKTCPNRPEHIVSIFEKRDHSYFNT